MTSSPIVARWELSRRLGTRRKELNLGVSAITEALGFTRNYWSAVENDRTLIAEDKLQQLFDVLQFEEPDRTELLALREASRERGWWDDYSNLTDRDAKRFYGYEDGAARIYAYESNILPGLLQTEEYTRALVSSDPGLSQLEIDDLVAVRRRRQRILHRPNGPEVTVLVSEAALWQQMNGPAAQARQLDHISTLIEEVGDTLQLRVIPFTTNPGLIVHSSTLLIFEFESEHLPRVVWQEAVRVLDIIESGDKQYRRLEHSWNEGLSRSLDHDSSVAIMNDMRTMLS